MSGDARSETPGYVVPGSFVRLECRLGSARKFWGASIRRDNAKAQWVVPVVWGRIGTAGSGKPQFFASLEEAREFLSRKKREKLSEGYVDVLGPVDCPHVWRDVTTFASAMTTFQCSRCGAVKTEPLRQALARPGASRPEPPRRPAARPRPRVAEIASPPERIIRLEDD